MVGPLITNGFAALVPMLPEVELRTIVFPLTVEDVPVMIPAPLVALRKNVAPLALPAALGPFSVTFPELKVSTMNTLPVAPPVVAEMAPALVWIF
jgi:hypothetical protein